MKKLIAISVVLALATFSAFADVGGHIIGTVNVFQDGVDSVEGSGGMNRLRLEGSGANEDGTFGAWLRMEEGGFQGLAWWKPIQQFKLIIGGNSDGIYGKEGVTGWGFQQMVSDTGVVYNGDYVWGWGSNPGFIVTRQAFYNGFDGQGLLLEIKPMDMIGINIVLPYMAGGELKEIFKAVHAQVDLALDFGNIAFTYRGGSSGGFIGDTGAGTIFGYFGLSAIDNVGLDIGFRFTIPGDDEVMYPIAAGLGAKITINDQFGIKARVASTFAGDDKALNLLFDILPYYAIMDGVKAFFNIGIIMNSPDIGDMTLGWHLNPYVEIGQEWSPTFYVGFKVQKVGDDDAKWALPIALGVQF
jgi:hypothetical protein